MTDILIIYIIFPVMLLHATRFNKKPFILQKSFSNNLKGFLAIYIIIHHYSQQPNITSFIHPMSHIGFLCVSFFLLTSGYGLRLSFEKSNSLIGYWGKRLSRLYLPFALSNLFTGILYIISGNEKYSLPHILLTSITLKTFYGNAMLWYIFAQIAMYIVFYFSYRFGKTDFQKHVLLFIGTFLYIAFCIGSRADTWRYNTIVCFPLGVMIGAYREKINKICSRYSFSIFVFPLLSFFLICLLVYTGGGQWIATSVAASLFALSLTFLSYKFDLISRFFEAAGSISYELYIVQFPIIYLISDTMGINSLSLLIILSCTFGIALLANRLSANIIRLFSVVRA